MQRSKTHGAGRLVRCSGGYEAYVPNPLPPAIEFSPALLRSLSDADRLIGRLAGEGRRLHNPHLLMRPFIKREAVLSSRIEGTEATLGELLAADVGATVSRSPDDLREVANYVTALEYGIERLSSLPLSLRLVTELHEKLMRGVRGEHATPGEFRRSQNWIGPPGCTLENASYVPPPVDVLMDCLGEWETFLHDRSLPPLVQAGMMHSQLEAIHPFLDGNGRVGRLLITLFLVERDILPTPLLYLSAFFEATRPDYYSLLKAVTADAAWTGWIEYFLNGVARMSEDALNRAERINRLFEAWHASITGAGKVPQRILGLLAANPYCTVRNVARELGVAFTTAQRGVDRLIALGVLAPVDEARRNRVFCAQEVMHVLDEPPHLVPASPGR